MYLQIRDEQWVVIPAAHFHSSTFLFFLLKGKSETWHFLIPEKMCHSSESELQIKNLFFFPPGNILIWKTADQLWVELVLHCDHNA